MDHKLIGVAVCNGAYTHTNIAMAMSVLELLGAPLETILEVEAYLYGLREPSTTEEA
jgi:hypothetical protein